MHFSNELLTHHQRINSRCQKRTDWVTCCWDRNRRVALRDAIWVRNATKLLLTFWIENPAAPFAMQRAAPRTEPLRNSNSYSRSEEGGIVAHLTPSDDGDDTQISNTYGRPTIGATCRCHLVYPHTNVRLAPARCCLQPCHTVRALPHIASCTASFDRLNGDRSCRVIH